MEGYITTTEAAGRLGISPARVRQLVLRGDLPTTKVGPLNMVKVADLELVRHRPAAGRPPKAKSKSNGATRKKASRKGGKK